MAITPPSFTPPNVEQLDGSAFQGVNCMCAAFATLVRRATKNQKRPTSKRIRELTHDRQGGCNMRQVRQVGIDYYDVRATLLQPIEWDKLMLFAKNGRGFLLSILYGPISGTKHDCFRNNFHDNHAVFVNGMAQDGHLIWGDPGADGRYRNCPKGFQHVSRKLAKRAAGQLDLQGLGAAGSQPLGHGLAYALLCPK